MCKEDRISSKLIKLNENDNDLRLSPSHSRKLNKSDFRLKRAIRYYKSRERQI